MRTLLGFIASAVVVSSLSAQGAPGKRSQFIVTKGKDTVAIELFGRDAGALTSEIYQTNGPRTQYTIELRPDSTVKHVELTRVNRANQSVGVNAFFLDGSVKAQMSAGGESQQIELPVKAAVPFLAVSFALCEQIIQATKLGVGKSLTLTAVRLGVLDTATLTVSRFHADSASFTMPEAVLKVALSKQNEVIGGTHVQQGWTVERKAAK